MRRVETLLPGVYIIEPWVFQDARGFFLETYHERKFAELEITARFVRDNHSRSVRHTLRGLHYQLRRPQAKLCRVILGEVLDVAVDIRRNSPHCGARTAVLLSAENKREVYVSRGFAHGFVVLSESAEAELVYKCDDFYNAGDEYGLAWDDPRLGIDCGVADALLSERDRRGIHAWRTARRTSSHCCRRKNTDGSQQARGSAVGGRPGEIGRKSARLTHTLAMLGGTPAFSGVLRR